MPSVALTIQAMKLRGRPRKAKPEPTRAPLSARERQDRTDEAERKLRQRQAERRAKHEQRFAAAERKLRDREAKEYEALERRVSRGARLTRHDDPSLTGRHGWLPDPLIEDAGLGGGLGAFGQKLKQFDDQRDLDVAQREWLRALWDIANVAPFGLDFADALLHRYKHRWRDVGSNGELAVPPHIVLTDVPGYERLRSSIQQFGQELNFINNRLRRRNDENSARRAQRLYVLWDLAQLSLPSYGEGLDVAYQVMNEYVAAWGIQDAPQPTRGRRDKLPPIPELQLPPIPPARGSRGRSSKSRSRSTRARAATDDEGAGLLMCEARDWTGIIAQLMPSVVSIMTTNGNDQGIGSGFVLSEDGLVVTNHHVVCGAREIIVMLADGRRLDARRVGSDPLSDIALLRLSEGTRLAPARLGERVDVGAPVLAIGAPAGLPRTATSGIVSATGRGSMGLYAEDYVDFLQFDATIAPGSSGGPLFDTHGEVVGVTTAALGRGLGFAVPVEQVRWVLVQLRGQGTVVRGWLGVEVDDPAATMGPATRGAVVVDAGETALEVDDRITAIMGQAVRDAHDLRTRVARLAPGTRARVRVLRANEVREFELVVGELVAEDVCADAPALHRTDLLPPKARRMWEHAYQSQVARGSPPARAAASAWAVVKRGYERTADGTWRARVA
ncbi:S1C family serine protease [Nannocystis exedens]|uniref:S1C family serine protease n=1 Tax=Nannocystis exedens TaxID=54 RepID=UPI000BBA0984|nr:ChaB family protein [Nannocystis exedens]PCC66463.1 serine protease DegQ (Precursor) [Nannocystis exedens]